MALAQALFFYCAVLPRTPFAGGNRPEIDFLFVILVVASACVAGAGYVINDCEDREIDEVNRPERVVVGRTVPVERALAWYRGLFVTGVLLGLSISVVTGDWLIGSSILLCALLLRAYSISMGKGLLIGNVIISGLTAGVLVVVYVFTRAALGEEPAGNAAAASNPWDPAWRVTALYAAIAFTLSMAREVIKDLEDVEGDARYGRHTIAAVLGAERARILAAIWLALALLILGATALYLAAHGYPWFAGYLSLVMILPLAAILRWLTGARSAGHYGRLSALLKLVFLGGILSTVLLATASPL